MYSSFGRICPAGNRFALNFLIAKEYICIRQLKCLHSEDDLFSVNLVDKFEEQPVLTKHTNEIQKLVDAGNKYDVCVAIGPMIMMKFVCKLTKELEIPTVVSLNPIMVDGTGMCGACRVTVGGEVKFACVDGPEFDGHLVNFEEAMERQQIYKTQEGRAYLAAKEGDTHHGGCGQCGGDK